ncbi:MAG: lysophospholipid acyltransferase family protein [Vicinamibacterales bacterium]
MRTLADTHNFKAEPAIWSRLAAALTRPLLDRVVRQATFAALLRDTGARDGFFEARALGTLNVTSVVASGTVDAIPQSGPLVVAANHPHGALDGLVLADVVRRRRPDLRLVANYWLARLPEMADLCFFVDPFGGPRAAARSLAGLRAAHVWLRKGGALLIFPAGEVSPRRDAGGTPIDSPWMSTVGQLALATNARVLPVRICGANSTWFYAAGRLHPILRTALLARELLAKRGTAVRLHIGQPIGCNRESAVNLDAAAVTHSIRQAVDHLGRAAEPPSVAHVAASYMEREIDALPDDARLANTGDLDVFLAEASAIPNVLDEIGRLRELTYRSVGEGTGKSVDVDAYDQHYLHLFTWDRVRRQVVGAYRLGRADRILATRGVKGLYTRSLFEYDTALFQSRPTALELGRSFVRAEYQRNYTALLLLWKGIGQYVVRHPQYRYLFGPVSISNRYSDMSQRLLLAFLEQNHRHRDAALVRGLRPPAVGHGTGLASDNVGELDRQVQQHETDRKGMPVLLRQYLKLNAQLLGCSIDPAFGDALDLLMVVDLTTVDRPILIRYLGSEGARRFLTHHSGSAASHAA